MANSLYMKNFILKNKKIFIWTAIVLVTAILIWFGFEYFLPDKNQPVLNTYFNSDYKYSLAIPSDWVGRYTPQEIKKGDTFFIYLGDGKTTYPIFHLLVVPQDQWQSSNNQPGAPKLITEHNGYVFVYQLAVDNPFDKIGTQYKQEFDRLVSQVGGVVKTISFSQ
jgi:hypothetical protein